MTGPFFRPFPCLMLEPGHYSPSFLANAGCVRKATLAIRISIRGDLAAPMAASPDDFQAVIEAPQVDGAPVKRLGAPGFWRNSKVDFIGTLTRAYQSVTQAGLDMALGDGEE